MYVLTGVLRAIVILITGATWLLAGFAFITAWQAEKGALLGIPLAIFVGATVGAFLILLYCFHTDNVERYLKQLAEKTDGN